MFSYFCCSAQVITADGSPVVLADQNATNGVIHVINRVEFPIPVMDVVKTAERLSELGTLVKAVVAAGLQNTLSGVYNSLLFSHPMQKLSTDINCYK